MPKGKHQAQSVPETPHGYEFLGPPGTLLITVSLPLLCYTFYFVCNDLSGCPAPSLLHPSTLTLDQIIQETGWPGLGGLFSLQALGWTLVYYMLSLTLYSFLPATELYGTELRSGGKLKYRFNAFTSALITMCGLALITAIGGSRSSIWVFIWDHTIEILTANLCIALSLATLSYARSFSVQAGNKHLRELAAGGHSGNIIYDWFVGRELNPRVHLPIFGTVDLKYWCEMRPGLLGWMILNFTSMAHQYAVHGYLSNSILLVVAYQMLYVLDSLYMEPAMMTTIDITTDGFGFMLAFGDLVWLPFVYSLQARYLAVHPVHLSYMAVGGIIALQAVGYYVFRAANNEKDRFRTNPHDPRVAHLAYITTSQGSKLLVSGWWGTARHINYLGDWIMAWSWCLPTGLAGYIIQRDAPTGTTAVVQGEAAGWGLPVTYFYVLFVTILFVHREMRDEEKCARKYGQDWAELRKKVRWRIIPYVY